MLRTVFLPSDNEYGYIKAIVRSTDVTAMINMGWRLTQTEIHEEKAAKEKAEKLEMRAPADPEGGMEVGSREWHRNALNELTDKDAIEDYVEALGFTLDKRGSVDTVREKALDVISGNG